VLIIYHSACLIVYSHLVCVVSLKNNIVAYMYITLCIRSRAKSFLSVSRSLSREMFIHFRSGLIVSIRRKPRYAVRIFDRLSHVFIAK